ncbi:MAG: type II secretion system F family protein [Candidatus Aenigmatarchaeota archaeon]
MKRRKEAETMRGQRKRAEEQELTRRSTMKTLLRLVRLEDVPEEGKVLAITVITSMVLLTLASFARNFGVMANAILISTFIIAVPQFLMMYDRYRGIKEMEEKFPMFLRDVIETLRSGMPLHTAIISASSFDYGKLTPEVKKMADQLTWGMAMDRVLNQFADRVRPSKRLFTSVKIIQESYLSGGDVASTLDAVSDNAALLDEAQKERGALLNQYVILMYAISLIFIGIVVAINNLMIPIFKISAATAGGAVMGIGNPCSTCYGAMCMVCNLYKGTASLLFSVDPDSIGAYYISLFFYMSLIQSAFSGLVAGQISENSVKAGIKHSMIMVAITFGAFYFLIYMGVIGA